MRPSDVGDEVLLVSDAVLISELLPTYEFISSSSQLMKVTTTKPLPALPVCWHPSSHSYWNID